MNRKKKRLQAKQISAELNIMPFIDIFSMLNTFLLVSAAFVNLGLIEVQIPFLTNAPPPQKPQRSLDIHVAVDISTVELETKWSSPPEDEQKVTYRINKQDLLRLHKDLVDLRVKHPQADTVNVHSEDAVRYKNLVSVLDQIMVRQQGDPVMDELDDKTGIARASDYIYRKVIMAGVIL